MKKRVIRDLKKTGSRCVRVERTRGGAGGAALVRDR